jgi:putative phosphoesterase
LEVDFLKLLCLSDLHVDHNNARLKVNLVDELVSYIRETAPDRVVVAGDMAGGSERCISYIEEIEQKSGVPLSYVPGNHSIWTNKKDSDSWAEYEALRRHPSSLIDRPIYLPDGWVLLGDMGWYDYSFRESHMSRDEVVSQKKLAWTDSVMARWGLEDEEVCDLMLRKFEDLLNAHREHKVIFVNHFVPYRDYVPVSPHNRVWNLIRPFLGTGRLGDLLDRSPQVRYVLFGHVHHRFRRERNGQDVICTPLGYVKEWQSSDPSVEVRASGTWIEI